MLEIITKEINTELEKVEIQKVLLTTTFKGLNLANMKTAMFEGMSRGFTFKDFLEKNIYAIPFKDGYSLITSIDYARKIGMRSGVIGKSEPTYEIDDSQFAKEYKIANPNSKDKIISCAITIKKMINGVIGEFSERVYFDEYYKSNQYKNSLWDTKPRTMIAKVAEMHALRMACPEELSQAYVEEEMEKEATPSEKIIDEKIIAELNEIKDVIELGKFYSKNKGIGKEFDKLVTAKKKFLEEIKTDENTQPTTAK
jgi:hypothetical protein